MSDAVSVFKITPTTQQYDWGKVGSSSKVAQLAAASKISGFTLQEEKPYAEVREKRTPSQQFADAILIAMDGNTSHFPLNAPLIRGRVSLQLSQISPKPPRPPCHCAIPQCSARKSAIPVQSPLDREGAEYPDAPGQGDSGEAACDNAERV